MEAVNVSKNPLTSLCFVKLDRNNYLLWKSMILPMLRGHKLDSYILGTKPCPEPFIIGESGRKTNPVYEEWVTNDQLLLGWLLNSISQEIATQLLHCQTSNELWEATQSLFGAYTRSRITLPKSEFHRIRKGTMKMEEYLNKMKNLFDSLTLAGSLVSTFNLITQTLSGLDIEYNPIVVQLADKENLTWVDLQAQLLAFENRLEQLNSLANLSLNPTANLAAKFDSRNNHAPTRSGWRGTNQRGTGRSNRGRGRGARDKPICQVCGKPGHVASHCYYCFDKTYMRQSPDESKHGKNGTVEPGLASTTERDMSTMDESPQPATPQDSESEIGDSTSNGNIVYQQDNVDIQNPYDVNSYMLATSDNHSDFLPPGYNALRTTLLQQESQWLLVKNRTFEEFILNDLWWHKIAYIVEFTKLIYNVLRACDTDNPTLHLVYEMWDAMIEKVKTFIYRHGRNEPNDTSIFSRFYAILIARWTKSCTPLY
ncbi:hypothetical protein L6164_037568 [Bauhinia variegata]|uniref:Uncharacterized protein n=1 Tax=Bauhinia variegata TaxID=167791 RepID=A0ACB9KKH2_BAUVA|nr:hypothetical protein L6164_037568 [Bauhinia variegata]